jgi:HK97 gp10 family phage protein
MSYSKNNLAEIFAGLDAYVDDIREHGVYIGAQAAAEVFYREAKLLAPRSDKGHWFHGTSFKVNGTKYWFEAGTLQDSIYQVKSTDNSGNGRATYHIAWNHKKCPYGFMVEYGTKHQPGVAFMRRAFDTGKPDALRAAKQSMTDYLAARK